MQCAKVLGATAEQLADVDDADEGPKAAAIELITSLRASLDGLKVSALKAHLRGLGVADGTIDELDDADEGPKAGAIALILQMAVGGAAAPVPEPAVAPKPSAAESAGPQLLSKYITAEKQIRVGRPEDSTHGVQVLMGLSDETLGQYLQDPVGAVRREFEQKGSADDKENLRCALNGIQKLEWTSGVSLDVLVEHPHAKMAKLKVHHVLALRLYTSSSFSRVNDPLRQVPAC